MENKKTFSERLNDRLQEAPGEIFKRGKWRFWFPLVVGLTLLNGLLTAWIFGGAGLQVYIGIIVATVGGLLCWLSVGNLHYSDSDDGHLARGVSLLDSITLCFVIGHFCFLLWAQGHLITLRGAETKYETEVIAYNDRLKNVSTDNVKIAEAVRDTAKETRKTAYHLRRAAETGNIIRAPKMNTPSLSTSPVELARPPAPPQSSAVFLSQWDAWIRLANFGELILAAVTLIYIRNRSAAFNAKNAPTVNLGAGMGIPATVAPLRRGDAKIATPVATVAEGQKSVIDALREHLRVIAFGIPNHWFKVDPIVGGVTIRLCRRKLGREVTVKQTRQSDKILAAVNRPDFRERLIQELIDCGFPIGGER